MVIIGIHGKARSGKTTAANYLIEHYGFMRMSFGDTLKEAVNLIFNIPMTELYSDKKDAFTRDVLQKLGTDCCRTLDPDVWVKSVGRRLDELHKYKPNAKIVIDDIRFPNEFELLKEHWSNAVVVKIKRNIDELSTNTQKMHLSETALDGVSENMFSAVYENTGTLNELHWFIDAVVTLTKER
jgi:dephospho-CoA kinase